MISVELIYDRDCPNISEARAQLRDALSEAGLAPRWTEWERGAPGAQPYVKGYGSPTVLVNGKDAAGVEPSENISSCRLYPDPAGGFRKTPSARSIATALKAAGGQAVSGSASGGSSGWRSSLATLPGLGAALLPAGVCPACWSVYAGFLGSLGLGFLMKTTYLLPLTALFLIIALGALGCRARRRRGYGPFLLGLAASALVLAGKFALDSGPVMYGGIALLVAASLWNGWPKGGKKEGACSACAPTEVT